MLILYIVLGILYFIYALMYIILVSSVFSKDFNTYKSFSKELNEKYYMFIRPEVKNVNKCSSLLCGLTLGFPRFYFWVFGMISLNL